jgi:hypothetical protein
MGATETVNTRVKRSKKNEKEGRKNRRGDEPCQGRRRSGQRPLKFQFARHHHHHLPPPPPHFVPYKGRSFVHVSPRKKKINHLGPNNNNKLNKKNKKLKFECWRAK